MEGRRIQSAVVTGASGMIGSALVRILIQNNIKVTALLRPNSEKKRNLPQSKLLTVIEAGAEEWKNLMPTYGADAFFHLAWMGTYGEARNDCDLQLKNIETTLDAVRLAERFGCYIFVGAGSQAEYKRPTGILGPDSPTEPETGYGIAKLAAGMMSRKLCKQLGMVHIWTRFFSVYGPGDNDYTMVMSGIRKMLQGERPGYTSGEQLWDYIYCDDAAFAMLQTAVYGTDQSIYCIGSGNCRPLADYIKEIAAAVGENAGYVLGAKPYFPGQVMHLQADIGTLTRDTGFTPATSFEKGIKKTVEWAKANPQI